MAHDFRAAMTHVFDLLFSVHPCLDFRTPLPELIAARHRCVEDAARIETVSDFQRVVLRYLALVGDGHMWLHVPPSATTVAPVSLTYVAGHVVVENVFAPDVGLKRGDVILTIDGQDATRALLMALQEIPAAEASWGLARAANRLLARPRGNLASVSVQAAGAGGHLRTTAVPLLSGDDPVVVEGRWRRVAAAVAAPFSVTWHMDERVAVLRYRTARDRAHLAELAARVGIHVDQIPVLATFCRDLFSEFRSSECHALVIDLRGNAGGDSTLAMRALYPYLFSRAITTYGMVTRVSPPLQSVAVWARGLPLGTHKHPPSTVEWPYRTMPGVAVEADPEHARQFGHSGKVAVLIDRETFSSAEWMAADLYDNGRAVFYGEPTGGGGSVPGEVVTFDIPEAEARLSVCCRFFVRPGPQSGAIKPHVHIPLSLEAFRAGEDPVLGQALAEMSAQ